MIRRPARSTRTDTLFPYTTLFRSTECESCAIVNVVARPRLPDVVTQFRQALLQVSNLGMQAWRGERAGPQMHPRPTVGLLRQCDQRSDERRGGKECVSTCSSVWSR